MENEKGTEEVVEPTTEQEVPPVVEEKAEDNIVKVDMTVEEYDLLKKKGADFDGMVEKNRLAKLAKKDAPKATKPAGESVDVEGIVQKATEAAVKAADERVQEINKTTYEDNLAAAFRQFTDKNKWANTDEHIGKISENFKRSSALTIPELVAQLDKSALENFPGEYTKSLEDKARSKVLAEDSNIQAGGSGAGAGVPPKEVANTAAATQEDIRIAEKFFGGDVARYLKSKERRESN